MRDVGRYGLHSNGQRVGGAQEQFNELEHGFFDTGTGIERGEVVPADEQVPSDAPARSGWRRRGGLAAGAFLALAIVGLLLAASGGKVTAGGTAPAPEQAALAQSPRR